MTRSARSNFAALDTIPILEEGSHDSPGVCIMPSMGVLTQGINNLTSFATKTLKEDGCGTREVFSEDKLFGNEFLDMLHSEVILTLS